MGEKKGRGKTREEWVGLAGERPPCVRTIHGKKAQQKVKMNTVEGSSSGGAGVLLGLGREKVSGETRAEKVGGQEEKPPPVVESLPELRMGGGSTRHAIGVSRQKKENWGREGGGRLGQARMSQNTDKICRTHPLQQNTE